MRIIETKVFKIEEHPNRESCYDYIRENWHDLNSHSVKEVVDSLNALSKIIGGTVKYSISAVSDRGEFIRFYDYSHDDLCRLSADDLPLTGVCWDGILIDALRHGDTQKVLDALHEDTEHIYSNVGLYEMCIANEYEFEESGKVI